MGTAVDTSQRLRRLERVLTGASPATRSPDDAVRRTLDRIDQLTRLLGDADGAGDEVDAVAVRLLLNDYTAMVGLLRATAQQAAARLEDASPALDDVRRFLWRDGKLRSLVQQKIDDVGGGAEDVAP